MGHWAKQLLFLPDALDEPAALERRTLDIALHQIEWRLHFLIDSEKSLEASIEICNCVFTSMKKIKSKLQLKSQTIRMLQVGEMEQVNGGRATFTCSGAQTGCSSHPPQHTPGSTNNGGGGGGGGGGNPGNP